MRTRLTKAQRHVLRYLSEHAAGGVTHVSVRALARALELSSSTARIAIQRLNDLGLVATSAVSRARPGEHLVLASPVAISLQLGMAKSLHVAPVPVAISTESTPIPVAISHPGPVAISLQTPGPVAISHPGPVAISTGAITTRAPTDDGLTDNRQINTSSKENGSVCQSVSCSVEEMLGVNIRVASVREKLNAMPERLKVNAQTCTEFLRWAFHEFKNGELLSPSLREKRQRARHIPPLFLELERDFSTWKAEQQATAAPPPAPAPPALEANGGGSRYAQVQAMLREIKEEKAENERRRAELQRKPPEVALESSSETPLHSVHDFKQLLHAGAAGHS